MTWLAIVKSLLSLLDNITKWLQQGQLLKAGEATAVKTMLEEANGKIKEAKLGRDNARHINESGGLHDDDGFRRD